MNYRKANIHDINQLVSLRIRQLIDEGSHTTSNIDNELNEYFLSAISDESLIIYIAFECDIIIATCGVCFFQYPPNFSNPTGKVAYITNVFTQITYRRQGIATRLLGLVMEEIKSRDYKVARLHASSQGKTLYQKLGFIEAGGFMMKLM